MLEKKRVQTWLDEGQLPNLACLLLWAIISSTGGQAGFASMPMTYPPQPLNGFMLCSFLTPSSDSRYTYPDNLQQELTAKVGPYPLQSSNGFRCVAEL